MARSAVNRMASPTHMRCPTSPRKLTSVCSGVMPQREIFLSLATAASMVAESVSSSLNRRSDTVRIGRSAATAVYWSERRE
eukprot:6226341-Prymnesium_polylepis.2